MKTIRRPEGHVSAAIFAAALVMPMAVGALAFVSTPAYAQTTPDSTQNCTTQAPPPNCATVCWLKTGKAPSSGSSKPLSSGSSSPTFDASQGISQVLDAQWPLLSQMLAKALQSANGNCTAVETAIAQAVEYGIAQYGSGATAAITSAIMNYAEHAGISPNVIGAGLAEAAAKIAATNASAASAIASTVANEGLPCEVWAFQSTAASLGYSNGASTAGCAPTPTGETGGGGGGGGLTGGGGGFPPGGGGGGGGGCLNPSCTKL
jgi:hypothetical protein